MSPSIKLYLKVFLFTGIPFGLLMMVFDIADGDGFNVWKLLFQTCFFGLTMSVLQVTMKLYQLKKQGVRNMTGEILDVRQQKDVTSSLSKSDFVERLKNDAILGKMKIIQEDDEISLNTRTTWKSWGEKIDITIQEIAPNAYNYHIISKPMMKTTLVDYGKNLENVSRIQRLIESAS